MDIYPYVDHTRKHYFNGVPNAIPWIICPTHMRFLKHRTNYVSTDIAVNTNNGDIDEPWRGITLLSIVGMLFTKIIHEPLNV